MKKHNTPVFIFLGIVFVLYLIFSGDDDQVVEEQKQPKSTETELEARDITLWPPNLGEIPVELETDPLKKNYYIIFDGSGSMEGGKLSDAKAALLEFIKVIPPGANIGMLVFDLEGISERVQLSTNREKLEEEINRVIANSGTPLKTAITMAYQSLELQGHKQQGYGEYNMVIVTDGEASDGEDPRTAVNSIVNISPIVIHTIGFKIGEYHSLNQPGKTLYKSATNLNELSKGLEEVLAESESFSVTNF